jgi:hypothetical protein
VSCDDERVRLRERAGQKRQQPRHVFSAVSSLELTPSTSTLGSYSSALSPRARAIHEKLKPEHIFHRCNPAIAGPPMWLGKQSSLT